MIEERRKLGGVQTVIPFFLSLRTSSLLLPHILFDFLFENLLAYYGSTLF